MIGMIKNIKKQMKSYKKFNSRTSFIKLFNVYYSISPNLKIKNFLKNNKA